MPRANVINDTNFTSPSNVTDYILGPDAHLNVLTGTQFHAVGQGQITTDEGFQATVNFILHDNPSFNTLNAVAHTDVGVLHFNSSSYQHTDQLTGPAASLFDIDPSEYLSGSPTPY
ncbi:hypothetical protein [Methylobacterium nodulans]|uniref:Uncharacterized protein n=1 Tax=Methylobacterium nodulans (strain LMG 21967 / CNCM I-2342 / ORS 2060) TaxID=460265 RepID=B8IWK5_METNO|nr:hypothetical protein [Methylobacterium nodulans]ACL62795.1 hypothetical protein Mnod_8739 [Methylobacterium nodulans ORS 2060]